MRAEGIAAMVEACSFDNLRGVKQLILRGGVSPLCIDGVSGASPEK